VAASSCSAPRGVEHPDITNASRAIKKSEVDDCKKNGVTDMTEVKIGYDGIVVANSKAAPQVKLTREQIFLALSKNVVVDGKVAATPIRSGATSTKACPTSRSRSSVRLPPPAPATLRRTGDGRGLRQAQGRQGSRSRGQGLQRHP
jgi:phosphate transport system substrate-binding protein